MNNDSNELVPPDHSTAPAGDAPLSTPAPAVPPADPWAHRRGEPRLFAFFWSLYILIAVAGALLWLAGIPALTPSAYSPAARTLLVVLAAGMTVLWPMTRLSQAAPDTRPASIAACAADVLVVAFPVQMVVWPLAFLAGWPADIAAGISCLFAAWCLLTGGLLALALVTTGHTGDPRARAVWMAACLLLATAAPLLMTLGPVRTTASSGWIFAASPFTGIYALSGSGWSGPANPIAPAEWSAIMLTAALAVALWATAIIAAATGSAARPRLH